MAAVFDIDRLPDDGLFLVAKTGSGKGLMQRGVSAQRFWRFRCHRVEPIWPRLSQ